MVDFWLKADRDKQGKKPRALASLPLFCGLGDECREVRSPRHIAA
jgi:hypothetical protein